MNTKSFPIFSFLNLFFTIKIVILVQSQIISGNPENYYATCGNTFSCGNTITGIGYPFRGSNDPQYCGHPGLVLTCDYESGITTMDIMSTKYRVLDINTATKTMRVVREDVVDDTCPQQMVNTTLDPTIFDFAAAYTNFTFLYGCPFALRVPGLNLVSCDNDHGYNNVYMLPGNSPVSCNASVVVPVLFTGSSPGGPANGSRLDLDQVLQQGFDIRWKIGSKACRDCAASKGRCGFNFETNRTACFCPDPPFVSDTCSMASKSSPGSKPGTGMCYCSYETSTFCGLMND